MGRSIQLVLACALWALLAMGVYTLLDEHSVLAIAFVVFAVTAVGLGGLYAVRPLGRWASAPAAEDETQAHETSVPQTSAAPAPDPFEDIPDGAALYPVFMVARGYGPFARWQPPGLVLDELHATVFRATAWAYQLCAVHDAAAALYSARAVGQMQREHLSLLGEVDAPLAETLLLMLQALGEHTGELPKLGADDADVETCLEYHLAVDMLEDDPRSPYRLAEGKPARPGSEVRDAARLLARCLAHARSEARQAFTGYFDAVRRVTTGR